VPSVCSAFQWFSTSLLVSLSIHRMGPFKTPLPALGGLYQEAIAGGEQIGHTEHAHSLELGRLRMAALYSYRITHDTGAAPNPFWGICTLVICRPGIRRATEAGDWIVGTGSSNSPIGDISDRVVYAMRVSQKMTMQECDMYTQQLLPQKVPRWFDHDPRRRLGDSVYDFSHDPPRVRKSVHKEEDREKDLGGRYALLSDHFWCFGDQAMPLPDSLHVLVKKGPGHRSKVNAPYIGRFLEWLYGLALEPSRMYGTPQLRKPKEEIPLD
jgi:hypothetical protein